MAKTVRIQGLREAMLRLDVIGDLENATQVQSIMLEAAKMITDEAADNIRERDSDPWKPKTIKVGQRTFQVAPGDLLKAVEHKPVGRSGAVAKIAFLKAPHAWFLEFGFRKPDGSMYPPEGFFRRAVQAVRRPLAGYIKTRMTELLREYSVEDPDALFARKKRS